jgi:hypothetical protein
LHVHLIRRRVETPADAAAVEPVHGIDSAERAVYQLHGPLGWAAPVHHHVEDAGVVQTRRHQASAVVHVEPVREHDLGEDGRVRSHGSGGGHAHRLRDGEAARVVDRGRLHRGGGGVRPRRLVEAFQLAGLAGVRAAVGVGVRGALAGLRALDTLLEVRVPVVLHLVVGPARQVPRDVRPPASQKNLTVSERRSSIVSRTI